MLGGMTTNTRLRTGSPAIVLYTLGAIGVFVFGVATFSIIDRNTDFAIVVFGSLVGGFLGALLASIVVVGVMLRSNEREGLDS